MGVPKFYRWFSERYPCLSQTVREHQIPEFDNLYLDMNGLIHPCSHPDDSNAHFRITEEQIFQDICHYVEFLFKTIKPRRVFFMAVDGVAPRAKMNQQRARRFRSARDAQELETAAIKRGETLPSGDRFDSNCITPGTPFMVTLHRILQDFVQHKLNTDPLWEHVAVYLSGHDVPGEGEHKIMDFVRYSRSQPEYDVNTRHCMYGLDADLIMLGLASHEPHFALLREEISYAKASQQKRSSAPELITFHLLHLSLFREYLEMEFSKLKSTLASFSLESLIDDWVLLGFLVGNDFIPHLPDLHINHGSLPMLWSAYMDILPSLDGYLTHHGTINLGRLEKFLATFGDFDRENYSQAASDNQWLESKKMSPRKQKLVDRNELLKHYTPEFPTHLSDGFCGLIDEPEEEPGDEQWNLVPLAARNCMRELATFDMDADIEAESDQEAAGDYNSDYGSDSEERTARINFRRHKNRYYKDKLKLGDVTREKLRNQAEEYVRGLQWILSYYYSGVPSWSWYYPFHYAPYVTDIVNFADFNITFEKGKPFKPFEQLMGVLPPLSKQLLPICYHSLFDLNSPVKDFYPEDFDTDINGKQQEWEAVVLIPFIDEKRLLDAMTPLNYSLTVAELKRNELGVCSAFHRGEESLGQFRSHMNLWPFCANNLAVEERHPAFKFMLPAEQLTRGLQTGVNVGVFFPTFPTFSHFPHTSSLRKAGVQVFHMRSREESLVVTLSTTQWRDDVDSDVAMPLLGSTALVRWPHLHEARVVEIATPDMKYTLVNKNGEATHRNITSRVHVDSASKSAYEAAIVSTKDEYMTKRGVDVGKFDAVCYVVDLVGEEYQVTRSGEVSLQRQWGDVAHPYPLCMLLPNTALHEAHIVVAPNDISELFSVGGTVFCLDQQFYGSAATVVSVDVPKAQVTVAVNSARQPNLRELRNKFFNGELGAQFFNSREICQRLNHGHIGLGMSPKFLGRITGCIFVQAGEDFRNKTNVGLDLKSRAGSKYKPGFAMFSGETLLYSSDVVLLIEEYLAKFPDMFHKLLELGEDNDKGNYKLAQLFPDEERRDQDWSGVKSWLGKHCAADVELLANGDDAVDPRTMEALAAAVDESVAKRIDRPPREVTLPAWELARPSPALHGFVADPTARYELFDRVITVASAHSIPLATLGTVVGLISDRDGDPNEKLVEVLFDSPVRGGLSIRRQNGRCYRFYPNNLLNLSHGRFRKMPSERPTSTTVHRGGIVMNKESKESRSARVAITTERKTRKDSAGEGGEFVVPTLKSMSPSDKNAPNTIHGRPVCQWVPKEIQPHPFITKYDDSPSVDNTASFSTSITPAQLLGSAGRGMSIPSGNTSFFDSPPGAPDSSALSRSLMAQLNIGRHVNEEEQQAPNRSALEMFVSQPPREDHSTTSGVKCLDGSNGIESLLAKGSLSNEVRPPSNEQDGLDFFKSLSINKGSEKRTMESRLAQPMTPVSATDEPPLELFASQHSPVMGEPSQSVIQWLEGSCANESSLAKLSPPTDLAFPPKKHEKRVENDPFAPPRNQAELEKWHARAIQVAYVEPVNGRPTISSEQPVSATPTNGSADTSILKLMRVCMERFPGAVPIYKVSRRGNGFVATITLPNDVVVQSVVCASDEGARRAVSSLALAQQETLLASFPPPTLPVSTPTTPSGLHFTPTILDKEILVGRQTSVDENALRRQASEQTPTKAVTGSMSALPEKKNPGLNPQSKSVLGSALSQAVGSNRRRKGAKMAATFPPLQTGEPSGQ